ncbi:MAG: CRTAC1 family protein [Planctomycetales bacterium]|nr:CRTAC1 family protein [Planctomycetales bacterium]
MTNAKQLPDEPTDEVIGAALKISLVCLGVFALIGGGVAAWWLLQTPPQRDVETKLVLPTTRALPDVPLPKAPFVDITEAAGIDFVHESGAAGAKLLPETMGGGCAFLDYDGDGDQDLLLINSRRWPWDLGDKQAGPPSQATLVRPEGQAGPPSQATLVRPEGPATASSALFANDGHGAFRDVSAETGIDQLRLYGMGVAVGDYDNDGDVDLYVTAVGENRLLRNENGRFLDVTEEAGVAGGREQWSTSCAWLDYNNDGRLDLFVCNYVSWSREIDMQMDFRLDGVGRAYGPPTVFDGDFPLLFRNEGDGKFTDVSEEAGVRVTNALTNKPAGKSMGIAPVDIDGDGWLDLMVANDTVQNFLLRNQGDGTFKDVGLQMGVAVGSDGKERGAMGIDTARHRNSNSLSVAIGNFANEMTSLYLLEPNRGAFDDIAVSTGLGPQTRLELTFGVCFLDVDLDGRQDLLCANGHLEQEINKVLRSQHYEQPPQLFWNQGIGHGSEFVPLQEAQIGADFKRPMVGRGATFADIDGDGDLDVLLTSCGGKPRLLRNDQQLGHHWLRVELEGVRSNRDAIGAWVTVRAGDVSRHCQVMPTRSYLSQSEHPVTIGLGDEANPVTVEILWPDGSRQTLQDVEVDRLLQVRQAVEASPGKQ